MRFDRCSFKISSTIFEDAFLAVKSDGEIEGDNSEENGDVWYINFRGYFGYLEFEDFNNIYQGAVYPGAPIVSFERANVYSNIMSNPSANSNTDRVSSVPQCDISEGLVGGYTNEWILKEKPCAPLI